MSYLALDQVVKRFGAHTVIDGVSLAAEQGEFVVFVGPSGCGKSTLLRLVAGLEEVSAGDVHIAGRCVTDVDPAARGVAMVFQSYALYPHMSVRQNMAFGMRMARAPKPEIERRITEAARILQIENLLDRRPRELSGGQRQRVAIGRAIVRDPKIFLFDEPLSNLDAELRGQMRIEIARLHRTFGATMVYVTHDQVEAMTLADRIVVLRAGRVEQIGSPAQLYDSPANTFVAGFIGSPRMNFLTGRVAGLEDDAVRIEHPAVGGVLRVPRRAARAIEVNAPVTIGLRPEHLTLAEAPARLALAGDFAENLGATSQLYAQAPTGETLTIQVPGRESVARGEALQVGFDPARVHLFDAGGQAI
ncbi:ABC transporter ATP-binding protein [Salinarimonas soli]|uniref:sn-glycerol-3-phosphate ABC transporter ATP-binding protein UgpC n=1 Tax=Salinarimonas soli TaxID=1638099 RepID=A0A5B2VZS7_9HYPH|nr:sn-glycerol-3-phosphate ABC transporter ATP-binding protein UgpC [Salinarimonas soli]KAA2244334.1 sn-glycerol-3-phosphate ABC transporter ATP-binding protein UgpC [Salinarimonas soli]